MSRLRRTVRLVCFDLDDTLIDTEAVAPTRLDCALERAALLGPRDPAATRAMRDRLLCVDPVVGGRLPALFAALDIGFEYTHAGAIRDAYNSRLLEVVTLMDGALEVLARARWCHRTAIVTNGPAVLQRAKSSVSRSTGWSTTC